MKKYKTVVDKGTIDHWKQKLGLTNEGVAASAKDAGFKLNKQALVDIPDGKGNPRLSTIDAIAAGLGIDPLELLKSIIQGRETEKAAALMCLSQPQAA